MFLEYLNLLSTSTFPILISPVLSYKCKEECVMTAIIKSIHKFEDDFDRKAERFAFHHQYIAFVMMFIGIPLFTLMAVAASTTVLIFPIAWILGWL